MKEEDEDAGIFEFTEVLSAAGDLIPSMVDELFK
jgi:hypothetical protein